MSNVSGCDHTLHIWDIFFEGRFETPFKVWKSLNHWNHFLPCATKLYLLYICEQDSGFFEGTVQVYIYKRKTHDCGIEKLNDGHESLLKKCLLK